MAQSSAKSDWKVNEKDETRCERTGANLGKGVHEGGASFSVNSEVGGSKACHEALHTGIVVTISACLALPPILARTHQLEGKCTDHPRR